MDHRTPTSLSRSRLPDHFWDDIPNVRVLMTTVGGKVIHLMPELASQIGMDPADPVTGATNLFEGYYRSEWN